MCEALILGRNYTLGGDIVVSSNVTVFYNDGKEKIT